MNINISKQNNIDSCWGFFYCVFKFIVFHYPLNNNYLFPILDDIMMIYISLNDFNSELWIIFKIIKLERTSSVIILFQTYSIVNSLCAWKWHFVINIITKRIVTFSGFLFHLEGLSTLFQRFLLLHFDPLRLFSTPFQLLVQV